MTLPGIILAGGRSTRMKERDKALCLLGGTTLLDRVAARLSAQCGPVALNANGDLSRFDGCGLPVLTDALSGQPGPLAGILTGMEWAAALGQEAVISIAVDTPFFPDDLVARLQGAGGLAVAASADTAGEARVHPVFGIWPVGLRNDLEAALTAGQRRVQDWAEAHGAIRVTWDRGGFDPFFNVNRPEDLAEAEIILAEGAKS